MSKNTEKKPLFAKKLKNTRVVVKTDIKAGAREQVRKLEEADK